MPSPFPGMDPYLEGDLWGSFHTDLATEVKRLLIPQLRPCYYPFTERYFLVTTDDIAIEARIKPDVSVTEEEKRAPRRRASAKGLAPLQMTLPRPKLRRTPQIRVAIRDLAKKRLVTAIEFLSPLNKRGPGRKQYLEKRDLYLLSHVNLDEIDLLREGRRLPVRVNLPRASYYVFISRAHARPKTDVWPIRPEERLPTIPIPLRKSEAEARLDLQESVDHVYDLDDFGAVIDYNQPPPGRLSAGERGWVRDLLKNVK